MEPAFHPFVSLGVALGIGLIIGLEREQNANADREENKGAHLRVGGARTYPLIALAGGVSMLLSKDLGVWIVGLVFGGLVSLRVLAYADDLKHQRDPGITSEVATVMTFLIGALALADEAFADLERRLMVTSAIGVATATLLSFKAPLHGFAQRISRDDIYAAIKFLVVTVIVLPLLPNEAFGPFDALNPFKIGLMVVFIAGIGFVGYGAVRLLGAGRGLGVTGLVGGLVSSTAVTLSMAARAKADPNVASGCALATLLASTVMLVRVAVMVAVLNEALLADIWIPFSMSAIGGLAACGFYYWKSRKDAGKAEKIEVENPFELRQAIKFGALFAVVLLASKALTETFGQSGSYVAGVVSGTTDVDAITLTMVDLAKTGLPSKVAATTILLAALSNNTVKAIMAITAGGWGFGKRTLAGFATMIVLGAGGLGVLWLT